jgi:hypothetical protein
MRHEPWEAEQWSTTYGPRVNDKAGDVVCWMSKSHEHEVNAVAALPELIAACRAVVTAETAPLQLSRDRAVDACCEALKKVTP